MLYYLLAILIALASGVGIYFLFFAVDRRPKRIITDPAKVRLFAAAKVFAILGTIGGVFAALSFGMMALQQKIFVPAGAVQIVIEASLALMAFGALIPAIVFMSFVFSLFPYSPRDVAGDIAVRRDPGGYFLRGLAGNLGGVTLPGSKKTGTAKGYIAKTGHGAVYHTAKEDEEHQRKVRRLALVFSILFAASIALVALGFSGYGYFTPNHITIKQPGELQPTEYRYEDIQFIAKPPVTVSNGEASYELVLHFKDGNKLALGRYSELAKAIEAMDGVGNTAKAEGAAW